MNIAFDVDLDDLVHFNLYHWRQSPTALRVRRRTLMIMAPLTGLMVVATANAMGLLSHFLVGVLGFATGAGGYLGIELLWQRFMQPFLIRRSVAEGQNKTVLGRHEIQLGDEGVTERTMHGQTQQSWSSIERVVDDDRYVFIYTQATGAHIIPKAAFEGRDALQQFLEAARSYHAKARGALN